jgi:hypothetical protein
MNGGPEAVRDGQELTAVRSQARAVGRRALLTTVAVTAVAVALP